MKNILASIVLIFLSYNSFGQTIAPDFTATDCNGDPQNLYTELNNGKTVIVIWVMPCIGCIQGTLEADSTRESLSVTYPNDVLVWIVDDGPPSNCATLTNWVSGIGLQPQRTFGNYNNEINQDNYGGFGMPHMMVVGANKQIYYNEFNTSGVGLYDAVQNAINLTTGILELKSGTEFTISPNPTNDLFTITAAENIETVQITSMNGQVIKVMNVAGTRSQIVHLDDVPSGNYLIKVRDSKGNNRIQKITKVNAQ